MDTRIRVGLIGPGEFARKRLIPALGKVPSAAFWSVLSRDLGRAHSFAKAHAASANRLAFDDLHEFLDDKQLDAVLITTNDETHAEYAIAAANAGKHVFIEKPMATRVDDARRVIDACTEADVRLAVGYHHRWHAGHRELARRLHAGEFGDLRQGRMEIMWRSQLMNSALWRTQPGGSRWCVMGMLGTHAIQLVRWMMGPLCGEVTKVKAFYDGCRSIDDISATVNFRFTNGAGAEINVSANADPLKHVSIMTGKGLIDCYDTLGQRGEGWIEYGNGQAIDFTPTDPYVAELNDFVSAIREGREPENSGLEGLRNIEIMEQADTYACRSR